MKLLPQGENLIVRFLPKESEKDTQTASGLVIPAQARKSPLELAEVLVVGPGSKHVALDGKVSVIPMPFQVGQKVVCARRNGLLIDEDPTTPTFLIPGGEVLAIVAEENHPG